MQHEDMKTYKDQDMRHEKTAGSSYIGQLHASQGYMCSTQNKGRRMCRCEPTPGKIGEHMCATQNKCRKRRCEPTPGKIEMLMTSSPTRDERESSLCLLLHIRKKTIDVHRPPAFGEKLLTYIGQLHSEKNY